METSSTLLSHSNGGGSGAAPPRFFFGGTHRSLSAADPDVDDKLHSFVTLTADLALARARQADQELVQEMTAACCTASRSHSKTFT
jgi:hypothetical protein